MKRIAVISDLHADVRALRDALARIDKLGCDLVICAGDVVGYGRFPEETIAGNGKAKGTHRGNRIGTRLGHRDPTAGEL